ncbi:uncharacterized protein N7458_008876 [Penicillium daleae]|uniref:Uncharacterized protein n=1 Tax=Penicillium daleae TaxID=63821 RepID=A0AAD6FXI4_9EURO|nr:uncharacterized protein N7458_008876 [Penicillium daleae]KAJ5437878.1 hypothetical protein N7458_008876 [Penicillium daleae]
MKGFVGGIPIALLAAAAQAMEHGTPNGQGIQTGSYYPHVGGTAMGGPSGNDEDGGFTGPFGANVQTHTDVDEYTKDDHSVNIKETDVYPELRPVFGPGEGPFPKRKYPHYGGTAIGGPSGNDEGQTFDMPMIANIQTTVDEYAKDDHSVKVKDTDTHPPPDFIPAGPPAGFGGPPVGFRQTANPNGDPYHIPATAFEKRWEPEFGGTALGGPSGGDDEAPDGFEGPFVSGGTAEGGPSGDDDGISFGNPITASVHTSVNEYSKDDHSIDVKNTDIYPAAFKRDWEPLQGGTAIGGPSGNDGGQTFSAPITVDVTTGIHEHYEDDHSIDLEHDDVYSPPTFPVGGGPGPVIPYGGPFRRAYSPDRVAGGGTALGGPSGEDGGVSFGNPTSVGVDSNVNEHSEDNHAIKVDTTHVHGPAVAVPQMPWMTYKEEAPIEHPGPIAPKPEIPEATPAPPSSAPISEVHEEQPAPIAPKPEIPEAAPAPPSAPISEVHEEQPTPIAPKPEIPEAAPAPPSSAPISEVHEEQPAPIAPKPEIPEAAPAPPPSAPISEIPEAAPAPPSEPSEEHEEVPQCASQVEEVVHTVTKTQYQEVHPTLTVYATPVAQVVQTSAAVPMSAIPEQSNTDPKVVYSAPAAPSSLTPSQSYNYAPQRPMSSSAVYSAPAAPSSLAPSQSYNYAPQRPVSSSAVYSAAAAPSSLAPSQSYKYAPQRPMSSSAVYSVIPVHVPIATPSSSSVMMSMATPSSSHGLPSGADALQRPSASAKPSAKPSAVMFQGSAARVSGGIASVAAAVFGVLAFVL